MLWAKAEPSRFIKEMKKDSEAVYLISDYGTTRIIPQAGGIARISLSADGTFSPEQGCEYKYCGPCEWSVSESEDEICVYTDALILTVNKQTSSISYAKKDGSLLFSERNYKSKQLDGFDSYKVIKNDNVKVELVETPDGVKRIIKEADKEFDKKLYHTRLWLEFSEDEKLYGLGQAEEGVLNLRGTTQYLHQANLKIAIPFLVSSVGYAIFMSTQSPMIFNDTQYGSYIYTEADEYMDYYVIAGNNMDELIRGFRNISGKTIMLPKWAFGYMQSQERYESAKEISDAAKKFRELDFGVDTIVLDWLSWEGDLWGQKTFDKERFPDPSAMTKELADMGIHFMISIWPNMSEKCDNYKEMTEAGLMLASGGIYDAFDKEGRKLYWEQVKRGLFVHGIDAWWCDSSEPLTPEWGKKDKPEPGDMYRTYVNELEKMMPVQKSNAYGLYHALGIYEGQREETSEKRVVNLTRSGYPGSQKYGTILWSGDTFASWQTLKNQIVAGLSFCASGLPYWTFDIGAFFIKDGDSWFWNGKYNNGIDDMAYRELYVRWYQMGAFLPIFRAHGTESRREPWQYGETDSVFYKALLSADKLRYSLMPYIYSLAGMVWLKDYTMLRMLVFDFPEDEIATNIKDEFMFGPAFLVCPVTEPMYYEVDSVPISGHDKKRTVYLPKGTGWYDYYTNEYFEGGQYISVDASIEHIPLFVRAGSIIPTSEPGFNTKAMSGADIELRVYPGNDGSFVLYEDAEDGYGYENGEYCLTEIIYNDTDKSVSQNTTGDTRFRKGKLSVKIIG